MKKDLAPGLQKFPGVRLPSTDFGAVQQGLRGQPLYREIDLSVAHSIAAGTQLEINAAGNSFYSDPLIDAAGLPIHGVATVRFQNTELTAPGTPFTVFGQAIMKIPFTKILIENPAQVGKRARFIYGVDVDFIPGINANVQIVGNVNVAGTLGALAQQAVGGVNTLQTTERGFTYGASFKSSVALAVAASDQIFAAASNPNGAILWEAEIYTVANGTATVAFLSLHAHTVAPTAFADGDILLLTDSDVITAVGEIGHTGARSGPVAIPAGKGLWFFNSGGAIEGAARRRALYTLL